jgi:hypothetical protein
MKWEVEYTDEFKAWWDALDEEEQVSVAMVIRLLQDGGVKLRYPHSSDIKGSKHGHMRELRIQHQGEPYRVLYAFDPRRNAILLIGARKTGVDRWYEIFVPIADKLYDDYLAQLKREGLL